MGGSLTAAGRPDYSSSSLTPLIVIPPGAIDKLRPVRVAVMRIMTPCSLCIEVLLTRFQLSPPR